MESVTDIIRGQAEDALKALEVQGIVTADHVADSVLRQTVYWEKPMPGGERLMFMRFFSPVVQREEVFLGNILFNAFLSKAFVRTVVNAKLGGMQLVANDLENYYFVMRTMSNVAQIADAFRIEIERSLPALFFDEHDEAKGIYGDLSRMFTFRKSDFEPFPVYAIPQFLAPQLEKAVRRELNKLFIPAVFSKRVRTVFATLAFFYGRTSGGQGDAQSFSNFIEHLVNDKGYDGILKVSDVKQAFNINTVNKSTIKQSIDDETYNLEQLCILLSKLSQEFYDSIDKGSTKWFMGFLHKDKKFVDLSPIDYLDMLLANIQLGSYLFPRPMARKLVPCRLCNTAQGAVEERYVTTGLSSFKFDNQSVRRQAEKACAKCALHSYLAQKLLGTEMVAVGGKLPQVPKSYNLIFHYGRHDDNEVDQIARRIDLIWSLVQQHHEAEDVRREIQKQVRDLQAKHDREQDANKKQVFMKDLAQKEVELRQTEHVITKVEDDIFRICPWFKDLGVSSIPAENCSLDVLSTIQLSESKVERHVLGLGMGGYRMTLFILPQIRAPYDAKEHDFAQRRFAYSRVTVTTLLSFLRELCGCDGPFYYQSLPALTPDAFQRDTFYVRNEPISIQKVQNEYEVVTQLAWKLIRQPGSDGFVRKVVLAEKLLEDPLGTFAAVMRDSPILGQVKGSYKKMGGRYREDWKAQDLTEYVKFIQRLSKLKEVK